MQTAHRGEPASGLEKTSSNSTGRSSSLVLVDWFRVECSHKGSHHKPLLIQQSVSRHSHWLFRGSSRCVLRLPSPTGGDSSGSVSSSVGLPHWSSCRLAWKPRPSLLRPAFQPSDIPSGGADMVASSLYRRHLQTLSKSPLQKEKPTDSPKAGGFLKLLSRMLIRPFFIQPFLLSCDAQFLCNAIFKTL